MDSGQTLRLAMQHHQTGNLAEAERLFRRILQTDPGHPDALHMLGVIAFQVSRYDLAIDFIRSALREKPNMPAAQCNLGVVLQTVGQAEEAVACFRRAIDLKPDYVEAHNNLGHALQNQGKLAEAMAILQQALRLRPGDAVTLTNLGNALYRSGRLDEAIAHHQQALRIMPTSADAHNNLGTALHEQGKFEDAAASYLQALRLKPDHVDALTNLGLALLRLGKVDEAIAHEKQALRLKPTHPPAHNNLGVALTQQGKLEEAAASYAQAVRLNPGYVEAHRNLGGLRLSQSKLDEALACYEQVVRLRPNSPTAHCELGRVLQEMGHFERSAQAFRMALQLEPRYAEALWGLSTQQRGKPADAEVVLLEQHLSRPGLRDFDRILMLFTLARSCDARGEYDRAAGHLREANALTMTFHRQNGDAYDPGKNARLVEKIVASFTPDLFARMRGFGLDSERPVFIFGLPRSGTTLTDQILAAHSQVFSAGELFLASKDFMALGAQHNDESAFAALPGLQRDTVRRVAQRHIEQLSALNGSARRIVDKMPDNYQYLGLLAVLFPRAKFIHCRRDLRDVALSCWITPLVNAWSNEFAQIVARFREYHRLMEHWRAVLPVPILEFNYEETVADLPGAARRLVEWCGLEWEPACLKFNEGTRPVRTASKVQVREPVYTRSVGRWRKYERQLSELFTAVNPLLDGV